MKSKRIISVCSLVLSIAFVAASCGGRSNQDVSSYSQEESDYSVSQSSSISRSSQDYSSDYRESTREIEKGSKLKICNTKWGFVDAQGNNFVLYIKGMARDGESAKTELEKNGTIVEYNTVEPKYRDFFNETGFMGYDFGSGTGNATDTKIYFSTSEYGWLGHAVWDYEEGFLYKNSNAYDAESQTRLRIKKVR